MNLACHKCTKPLQDASQRGPFSCDFCGSKHKKGEFRLRCQNKGCDFDLDQNCAQRFLGFNQTFSSQKSQCAKCKYPLLNATYSKNTKWSCNDCKGKFEKYSQLRLRCEAHDYDICGGCNAKYQSQFNVPQQQGFNAPPQQQQGFNAPPQQQQGFNAPPQQQQGFNAPPQQQQGFNQPPQQQSKKPIIACHKCTTVKLIDATDRNTNWKCDFCARNHKKGDYRLRCNKHDFDVCFDCAQRFSDFDQSYESWKHACKTCKHPLTNQTYAKNTKWSCDQCKNKYEKFSQLRLRCDKHDYDLCGNCCKNMQQQFNQPGAIISISTGFGNLTISSGSNTQQQPPQQQQFNQPPPQQQQFNQPPPQQQGFNQPPPQQQGFNQPPQQQQGFNQPPQQQQTNGEQVFIGGVLQQDQVLRAGQFISSPSNQHHLFMQFDGNLVLYSDRSFQPQYTVWSTNTANKGQSPHLLKLQADGNLVIYDRTNTTTWASNTYNTGAMPYKLCVQEDRNICLYDRNNQVTFQTNTAVQQQQQGFNAPPQQQQGFNAPPQQQQGFNAPPGQNPQLAQIEKDQAALNQKKQKLEQEKQKLNQQLQNLQTQNNQENQKLQAELAQLPNKQATDLQQLKAKQDAEMQQLIQRQEQERQKLINQQQQATQKLTVSQTQEKTKIEANHQKIHQQQQVKVSKVQTDLQKVDQQLHGLQTEQSTIDQRRKMIPQQQGFNQPPISFQ